MLFHWSCSESHLWGAHVTLVLDWLWCYACTWLTLTARRRTSIQVYKHTSIHVYIWLTLMVRRRTSIRVYKYTSIQVYKYTFDWLWWRLDERASRRWPLLAPWRLLHRLQPGAGHSSGSFFLLHFCSFLQWDIFSNYWHQLDVCKYICEYFWSQPPSKYFWSQPLRIFLIPAT